MINIKMGLSNGGVHLRGAMELMHIGVSEENAQIYYDGQVIKDEFERFDEKSAIDRLERAGYSLETIMAYKPHDGVEDE